jgi:hypothetical protein
VTGPVFVLTAHRSGGTALARGLNRHPDLLIWGEHAGFINKLAELDALVAHYPPLTQPLERRGLAEYVRSGKFDPDGFDPWRSPFERADFRNWCRHFIEATFRRGLRREQRWGFKEVRYHRLVTAQFLVELFPTGRFVILRRELGDLVLSNMLTPWSIERLKQLGVTTDAEQLRAAVFDCAYALAVVDLGFEEIKWAFPRRTRIVPAERLADPVGTFAELFDFLGLSHWPALLEEVREASQRRYGTTDYARTEGVLSAAAVQQLIPEAIATAKAELSAHGQDHGRLRRFGDSGRFSFLAGDHEVFATPYSTLF